MTSVGKCLPENLGNVLSRGEAASMVVSNVEPAWVDCESSKDVRCWWAGIPSLEVLTTVVIEY